MTLGELRDYVAELLEDGVPEQTKVKLAIQPNYPLEHEVAGICTDVEAAAYDEPDVETVNHGPEQVEVVYLAAREGNAYCRQDGIWEAARQHS